MFVLTRSLDSLIRGPGFSHSLQRQLVVHRRLAESGRRGARPVARFV